MAALVRSQYRPPFKINHLVALCYKKNSLPFKGRARVGMGSGCVHPTPIPAFPLKGKEFLWKFCNTVQLARFSD